MADSDTPSRENEEKKSEEAGGGGGFSVRRYADLIGIAVVMFGIAWPMIMGDGSDQPPKLDVVELDQSFYKTVLYPEKTAWDKGGPNNVGVSWAVFFHKPYCGACRRIRPMFYALARHTNSSEHLRFASVDCVKYRVFCKREKVDREPLIRLYQAVPETNGEAAAKPSENTPPSQKSRNKKASSKKSAGDNQPQLVRRGVADWKGMLVAYEVLSWFKNLELRGPLRGRAIRWPNDDVLAQAMEDFKKSSLHTGVKLAAATTTASPSFDPKGYLVDIKSAVMLGLVDDVFGAHTTSLDGKRLETLVNFIETLAHTYPEKAMRENFMRLRHALVRRDVWGEKPYKALLSEWGAMPLQEPPPTGNDIAGAPSLHYKWCRSNEAGVGGYPCGLWLLFHTMIANSDSGRAHLTLLIIYEWVQSFYGCVECAVNFNTEWEEEGGAEQYGHVGTSLWLWKVHNMVRARLTEDDDSLDSPKIQWPAPADCTHCLSDLAKERLGLPLNETEDPRTPAEVAVVAAAAGAKQLVWNDADWTTDFVFAFLQETFCAGSDTFICAGFVDEEK